MEQRLMLKQLITAIIISFMLIAMYIFPYGGKSNLPIIAIANYGPHSSLSSAILGFKEQMEADGFVENKTIQYAIADVGFDPALIPQMLTALKAKNPEAMLVMTTPVAQSAKGKIKDIPLIYTVITDPVEAGLIKEKYTPEQNMTGSSDMQDLRAFLQFAKSLLPAAKKIGLLYSTSESNDAALVNMMREASLEFGMEIIAIAVEQARDVPIRVQEFKDKADLIYVGSSGPIQPTLPAIAAEARKMKIPVFNMDEQAVKDGLALASFAVDYKTVGRNAAKLAIEILRGKKVNELTPLYPKTTEHRGLINKNLAVEFGIDIPQNVEIVE
jgi:putative tryptophan/tyrosine transport system substrate-binding protein